MRPSGARRLRELLDQGRLVTAPGVADPFCARIVERAGFAAVYLGGNALGLTLAKGQPLITLTETVQATAGLVRAVDAPVVVDAGAGFGDPPHVYRAVLEIESAGAAALHIDDQPYPKRPGYHRGSGALAPVELMCARLSAAAAARRDADLLLIARTDALRVTGSLNEAIARGRAYAEAGAEALMVLDLQPDRADAVRAALPGLPLVWIGGVPDPAPPAAALEAAGFVLALYPFNTLAAIGDAVTELWTRTAATGTPPQDRDFLVRMRHELQEIVGMQIYWQIEDRAAAPSAGVRP